MCEINYKFNLGYLWHRVKSQEMKFEKNLKIVVYYSLLLIQKRTKVM